MKRRFPIISCPCAAGQIATRVSTVTLTMVTLAKGAPEDHQLKPSRRVTFTATSGPRTRSQDVFPASQRGLNPEEETVNAATMSFLQALTLKTPGNDSRWLMRRLALKARFRSGSYEARTDGYLQSKRGNQKLQAIVEVKAKKRGKVVPEIQMQESAQMVA